MPIRVLSHQRYIQYKIKNNPIVNKFQPFIYLCIYNTSPLVNIKAPKAAI
jgi:hypothetical protein